MNPTIRWITLAAALAGLSGVALGAFTLAWGQDVERLRLVTPGSAQARWP